MHIFDHIDGSIISRFFEQYLLAENYGGKNASNSRTKTTYIQRKSGHKDKNAVDF